MYYIVPLLIVEYLKLMDYTNFLLLVKCNYINVILVFQSLGPILMCPVQIGLDVLAVHR